MRLGAVHLLRVPGQARRSGTTRFFRALHQGCIPVTFWVNSDLPYRTMGLDFSRFSVNISPPQIAGVKPCAAGPSCTISPGLLRMAAGARRSAALLFPGTQRSRPNAPASITAMLQAKATQLPSHGGKCTAPKQKVLKQLADQEAAFQLDIVAGNPFMHWNWGDHMKSIDAVQALTVGTRTERRQTFT